MINVLEEEGPVSHAQRELHLFAITSLLGIANRHPSEFKSVVSILGPNHRTKFEVCLKEYMSQESQKVAAGARRSIVSAKSIKLASF
jgi:hypothetical protein